MPVFYTIHNLGWGQGLSNGRRNCRTFIFGVFIYVMIYIIIANLKINHYLGDLYHAVFVGFIILLVADISVMGYYYRSYFGRPIFEEFKVDNDKKWKYDQDKHKYIPKPIDEKIAEKLEKEQLLGEYKLQKNLIREEIQQKEEQIRQEKLARQEAERIKNEKIRINAARVIQRWWRDRLYRPGDGLFYKKAQEHYNNTLPHSN